MIFRSGNTVRCTFINLTPFKLCTSPPQQPGGWRTIPRPIRHKGPGPTQSHCTIFDIILLVIWRLIRCGSPGTIIRSPNCLLPINNLSGDLQLYILEVNLSEPQFAAQCVFLTILNAICHSVNDIK